MQLQLLISHLKSLLSAYISQGVLVVADELPGLTSLPDWKAIITKIIRCSDDVDEHIYKLLIKRELSRKCNLFSENTSC